MHILNKIDKLATERKWNLIRKLDPFAFTVLAEEIYINRNAIKKYTQEYLTALMNGAMLLGTSKNKTPLEIKEDLDRQMIEIICKVLKLKRQKFVFFSKNSNRGEERNKIAYIWVNDSIVKILTT